jgi:hypothetical protein
MTLPKGSADKRHTVAEIVKGAYSKSSWSSPCPTQNKRSPSDGSAKTSAKPEVLIGHARSQNDYRA